MPRVSVSELDATEKGHGSDMNLYFNHTFCLLSVDGVQKEWVKYMGAKPDGHWFQSLNAKETLVVPFKHPKAFVEWVYPTGWFNYKSTAIYCERVPKRQYHKGLTSHNFSAMSAETVAHSAGFLATEDKNDLLLTTVIKNRKLSLDLGVVSTLFTNPQYQDYEEAYVLLKSKKAFSRALSRDFALMPHCSNKNLALFCHEIPVGEVVHKNKIKVFFSELKSECQAFFSQKGVAVVL